MSLGTTLQHLVDRAFANTLVPGLVVSQAVTVRHTTEGAYNPATGETAVTTSSISARAIIRPYTMREVAMSGGLIVAGDVQLRIPYTPGVAEDTSDDLTEINRADQIIIDNNRWDVMAVSTLQLDGNKCVFVVQARDAGPSGYVLASMADETATHGVSHTCATPSKTLGLDPIEWAYSVSPSNPADNFTFDTATGVLVWTNPTTARSPMAVTLTCSGPSGTHNVSFDITVSAAP